jgi:hypothetical protein
MSDYEHGIEVAKKNGIPSSVFSLISFGQAGLTRLVYQADFILDLTTFKALKHRCGGAEDLTPTEVAAWLTHYLDTPHSRVLLLTD